MSEDQPTPPAGSEEEPLLEISAEELSAPAPPAAASPPSTAPVPESPPAPVAPAPVEAAPPAPVMPAPVTPAPAAEVAPPAQVPPVEVAPAPVAYQPPAAAPAPEPQPVAPAPVVTPAPAAYEQPPAPVVPQPVTPQPVTPQPVAPEPQPVVPEPQPAAYAPAAQPVPTPVMGGDQWYTTSGGQVYGPYSADDIRAWLRSGQVSWDTQASRGEGDPWRPLSAIAEFNPTPAYGAPVGAVAAPGRKDKTVAGILGILLGAFGAHHWYLGNYMFAGIYLGVTVITLGMLSFLPAIAGVVEGIIYLTAPDDRFQRNQHKWFLSGP